MAAEDARCDAPCVLAMDPGRAKCGLAVVRWDRTVLARQVVPSEAALVWLARWNREYRPRYVVLGDATTAREWRERLEAVEGLPPVMLVDEARSSEEGRRRYVELHRRGWRRWVPAGLLTPGEPYDDLVAVILAERFLAKTAGRSDP